MQQPLSQYIFPILLKPIQKVMVYLYWCRLISSTLFEAYTHGLFPWFNEDEPICWWSPEPRCIIEPHAYKPSKSLIRNMKNMIIGLQ
jgi:leucyl/phenylalanyl-tRNA--protein transferase